MDFDIELVDFYPEYSNKFVTEGTIHVYIKNIDMDIRGIRYIRKKNSFFVFLPNRKGWDNDEKKFIQYPIVSFTNKETQRTLINDIRLAMDDYFKTWVRPDLLPTSKSQAKERWVKDGK